MHPRVDASIALSCVCVFSLSVLALAVECVGDFVNDVERLAQCESVAGGNLTFSSVDEVIGPRLRYITNGSIIITNVSNSSILFPRLLSVHGGSVRVHDYGGRLKRLEGFHALELIEGDLEISEAPNLTGWDAFTSLSRVTGSVTLKTLAIATVGLPSLMDVGIFTARGLPALNSLKGLENLRSVRKLELDSEYESWSFGECGSINVTATPPVRNVCNDSHMTCVDNRCVETLLSTLANAIEVRTFTSLVLHDELYSRRFQTISGHAMTTVFAPKDIAWYHRNLTTPARVTAAERSDIIAAHVVMSSSNHALRHGQRLITDLGVKEVMVSASSDTVAHSLVAIETGRRRIVLGGFPVKETRCRVYGTATFFWKECLPSMYTEIIVKSSDARLGVESKFSRAEQSIGPIFASLESRADGDDAFSEEDLDFEEEYVRALLFDEIIAPSSSSSSSSSAFASNSNVHGAIVDSARRSSNGIVLIVDGTLFPRRLDRVPAPQANGSSSPIPSRPPPTPTPQFLSPPSPPAQRPPPPPAQRPPPPILGSFNPIYWQTRPPPPSATAGSAREPPPSPPPSKGSCLAVLPNICGLCDFTDDAAPCCCDSECAQTGDCCSDYAVVCLS